MDRDLQPLPSPLAVWLMETRLLLQENLILMLFESSFFKLFFVNVVAELYEDVPVSPQVSTRRCFGVLFWYWAMQWQLARVFWSKGV